MDFYNFGMDISGAYNYLTCTPAFITTFGMIANNGTERIDLKRNTLVYIAKNKKCFLTVIPYMNSLCQKLDKYIEPEKDWSDSFVF